MQTISKVKERMLKHLGRPPVISELASLANMNFSKLLDSYSGNYLAKGLLLLSGIQYKRGCLPAKEEKMTVSEAVYVLGFNLPVPFFDSFNGHMG